MTADSFGRRAFKPKTNSAQLPQRTFTRSRVVSLLLVVIVGGCLSLYWQLFYDKFGTAKRAALADLIARNTQMPSTYTPTYQFSDLTDDKNKNYGYVMHNSFV